MQPAVSRFAVSLVFVMGVLAATHAHASRSVPLSGPASPFAPVESVADKPLASWFDYCRRHPADCSLDLTEPTQVKLTPRLLDEIRSINLLVNTSITPETDLQHWGVMDHWDQAEDEYGDCEDYQLLKRALLVKAGVPRRALLMTVVLDAQGEGHALLMIRTDKGD